MTTRLIRDDNFGVRRECNREFDPVAEGARHQLSAEVSLAIWEYVSRQLTSYGSRDELLTQECYQEVATRIAARRGRLSREFGGVTRLDAELGKAQARRGDRLAPRVPGRTTLVLVEAARSTELTAAAPLAEPSPLIGTRLRRTTRPEAVAEPAGAAAEMIATMARSEFPGASEVARAITALRAGPQHPDGARHDEARHVRDVATPEDG